VEFHLEVGALCAEVYKVCLASGKVDCGERPRSEARCMRMLEERSKTEVARVGDGGSYKLNAPKVGI